MDQSVEQKYVEGDCMQCLRSAPEATIVRRSHRCQAVEASRVILHRLVTVATFPRGSHRCQAVKMNAREKPDALLVPAYTCSKSRTASEADGVELWTVELATLPSMVIIGWIEEGVRLFGAS